MGIPKREVLEASGGADGLLPLVEGRVDADADSGGLGSRDAFLDVLEVAVDVVPAAGALLNVEPQHAKLDVVGLEEVDQVLDGR